LKSKRIEARLEADGRRLREERYPRGEAFAGSGPPRRSARIAGPVLVLAAAAVLAALLLDTPSRGPAAGPVRAALVAPPEGEPIQPAGEPLCAALDPPLPDGEVRVFFDERDVTDRAEWNGHFVILDPPGPVRPGSHLFRLELTDRRGRIVGEPSWLIVAL